MKLKSGDEVLVLQGKDRGKKGKIEKLLRKKSQVLVTGLNLYKKHIKKRGNKPGGITQVMKPLAISKVGLVCPKCNLATKISFKIHNDQKIRVCKKCRQEI
ncbi:MAG TPA: 50S ribosomal protein L24 [Candidatus Nanoarchaeia archaeon]